MVNVNAVSAALGWTIAPVAPSGSAPSLGTWTKPGAAPYLNLCSDARVMRCNAASTEGYISVIRKFDEKFWINEVGAKFDGPLFDVRRAAACPAKSPATRISNRLGRHSTCRWATTRVTIQQTIT